MRLLVLLAVGVGLELVVAVVLGLLVAVLKAGPFPSQTPHIPTAPPHQC